MTLTVAPPAPKVSKTERRRALEAPHREEHDASMERRMSKGIMPKALPALLRWFADGWDMEVPDSIHKSEVWRDHGTQGEGGSRLGAPAHTDPFRRYMENTPSELDPDGFYLRPMHAALDRLGRRKPLTARTLFALAMSGYDWRSVAERLHYADEMFEVYIAEALRMLWVEHSDRVVRLQ